MKINNIALIIFCFLLIPFTGNAQNEAEFEAVEKTYTLHADGSQEQRIRKVIKLYTYTAMRRMYGESFIVYNPDYQQLRFNESYTIMKDGTKVNVPENAFVPVLPRFANKAPYFNNLIEMVVVHTGLELGATVYLDYTIKTKAGIFPELDIVDYPNEESPIKNYRLTVHIPQNKELNFFNYGKEKIVQTTNNGFNTYTLTLKNLPANIHTNNNSEHDLFHAPIQFSTYTNVEEAVKKYGDLILSETDLSTQTYAEYLTEGCLNNKEKLMKILNYTVYNIDQVNIPLALASYQLRSLEKVRNSAYGTYEEKLAVLNAMLQAVDIHPTLCIATKKKALGLEGIETAALKVSFDDSTYYLSPSQLHQSSIGLMAENLNLYEYDKGKLTALQPIKKVVNHKTAYSIEISKKGKSVKETVSTDYVLCAPGENPIKERTFSAQIKEQGGLSILYLPHNTFLDIKPLNKSRKDSFEILAPFREKQSYDIDICTSYEIIKTSDPIEINTPIGNLKITCTQNKHKLHIIKELNINHKIITPENYSYLVSLVNTWNRALSTPIILKNK